MRGRRQYRPQRANARLAAERFSVFALLLWANLVPSGTTYAAPASLPASVSACLPSAAQVNGGFTLAGVGRLGPSYPRLPRMGVDSAMVPPAILKAIAWIESNWRQFDNDNVPLLSPDFGYGIMQITSGMANSAGAGTIPLTVQNHIGGDYLYNIAYGARMLATAFNALPAVNNADPTILEDWYYAIWAYNGWGWVNNPNNPRFTRQGNPATNPSAFPYQERVYYLIQHPPADAGGRPLWAPMKVSLPQPSAVKQTPRPISIAPAHHEYPHLYGASYDLPRGLTALHQGDTLEVHVTVENTGGLPWKVANAKTGYSLTYHWVRPASSTQPGYDPQLHGIDVLDGAMTAIPSPVPIASSIRVHENLRAPSAPGEYRLEWDMAARSRGWFSHNSVEPGIQTVDVVASGVSIAPYVDPAVPPTLRGDHAWLVTTMADRTPAVLHPGDFYSRTILLFNPGGRGWGRQYGIQQLPAGMKTALPVRFVAPCRTVPVTISARVPRKPGAYDLHWQMTGARGLGFGPIVNFTFTVKSQPAIATPRRVVEGQPVDIIGVESRRTRGHGGI